MVIFVLQFAFILIIVFLFNFILLNWLYLIKNNNLSCFHHRHLLLNIMIIIITDFKLRPTFPVIIFFDWPIFFLFLIFLFEFLFFIIQLFFFILLQLFFFIMPLFIIFFFDDQFQETEQPFKYYKFQAIDIQYELFFL